MFDPRNQRKRAREGEALKNRNDLLSVLKCVSKVDSSRRHEAFFSSVEQRSYSELVGKPVVVEGKETPRRECRINGLL